MLKIPISLIQERVTEYIIKADQFLLQGTFSYALAYLFRGLGLAEILGQQKHLVRITLKIIQVYNDVGDIEMVIEWTRMFLEKSLKPELEGEVIEYLVSNLIKKGDFEEAHQILVELILSSNLYLQRAVHTNLGLLYIYLFRYLKLSTLNKGEKCLHRALQMAEVEGNEETCGLINIYLALLLVEEGLYYNAREQFLLALSQVERPTLKVQIINELAKACLKLFDYESAEEYLNLARTFAEQIEDFWGLAYNRYYWGLLYIDLCHFERGYNELLFAVYEFLKKDCYLEAANIYLILSKFLQDKNPEKERHYQKEYQRYIQKVSTFENHEFLELVHKYLLVD